MADQPSIPDPVQLQLSALGAFLRAQRRLADLSLRDLQRMTQVSNAYLSQVERGLHQPSLRVLRSIASALDLPVDQLLQQAGWTSTDPPQATDREGASDPVADDTPADGGRQPVGEAGATAAAIAADPDLSPADREVLLGVYRSLRRRGQAG